MSTEAAFRNGINGSLNLSADHKWTSPIGTEKLASETAGLLQTTLNHLTEFISRGENERAVHQVDAALPNQETALVNPLSLDPEHLRTRLEHSLTISDQGSGLNGFENTLKDILKYSVNSISPGFLDKLYSAPVPPGIAAELILGVLNANVHVYQNSPVLTIIEKHVTKSLAALFGLDGPRAGGIGVQGGSASNTTSIVAARNTLYPETKTLGNSANGLSLVILTSAHGHYSIEKAAQALGLGSTAVIPVPTDASGRMRPDQLEQLIVEAKSRGKTPFYVNATAGTTVLGSFDLFEEISKVTRRHRCWLHIDGAWGGSFVFAKRSDLAAQLKGCHLADSIAVNPHKMLGIPLTCSFLLTRDLRMFQQAMTLKAGYLFHEPEDDVDLVDSSLIDDETAESRDVSKIRTDEISESTYDLDGEDPEWSEPNDIADMTLQCGRRGDSLKFFLAWQYYGTAGYAKKVEDAYDVAVYMSQLVDSDPNLSLVLGPDSKPSCLQVCFHYTPSGGFVFGLKDVPGLIALPKARSVKDIGKQNTRVISRISQALILRGFMVDFAPALEGQEDKGHFLRVVVNISTTRETASRLIREVVAVGDAVVVQLREKFL